jgi:hypothetical protein
VVSGNDRGQDDDDDGDGDADDDDDDYDGDDDGDNDDDEMTAIFFSTGLIGPAHKVLTANERSCTHSWTPCKTGQTTSESHLQQRTGGTSNRRIGAATLVNRVYASTGRLLKRLDQAVLVLEAASGQRDRRQKGERARADRK